MLFSFGLRHLSADVVVELAAFVWDALGDSGDSGAVISSNRLSCCNSEALVFGSIPFACVGWTLSRDLEVEARIAVNWLSCVFWNTGCSGFHATVERAISDLWSFE